ncbi:MAG TPA: carbohydrate ABC transporter permease [Galbitalea sp.]|jgi:multiple sugar transport system permease protein
MTAASQGRIARRGRMTVRIGVGKTVAALVALSLALVFLLPIIWMAFASFRTIPDLSTFPPTLFPRGWTLDNYTQVFQDLPFARLYLNTTLFAGIVTVGSLFLDSMAGYALARLDFPGRRVIFVVVILLLLLPFQVTLVPLYVLMHNLGLVNTLAGLVLPRISNAFGIFFMRQFFLGLPKDLEDAARVDGASEWRIFASVVLPLARPALLTLGLFYFQTNWNDLLWPLIMTNDVQDATLPAGLSLFNGEHNIHYGVIMAGAVLSLLPIVALFLLVQRSFVQGIATTGVK